MEIELSRKSLPIFRALDSETRIDIINILSKHAVTVTELADKLHYSKAVISKHVKLLIEAGILTEIKNTSGDKRTKKLQIKSDNISINLPQRIFPEFRKLTYDITLGNYFSTTGITPTCGMANKHNIIERFDDPKIFLSSKRFSASLIWFSSGSVEYVLPNEIIGSRSPEMLEISFEISSEFPQSNNRWPSDITFWINDIKVGTWTVPGNFSDIRGKLTPSWWDSSYSQYGLLKHLRILKDDTGMDGQHLSDVTIDDLLLQEASTIRFKIGIDPDSKNQGGLTIFGKDFGNYPQDIKCTFYYSEKDD